VSCPEVSFDQSVVEELVKRWLPGARFVNCAARLEDGTCVGYDSQFYPATPREYSDFIARYDSFLRDNDVQWLGECYDCEDFAQLASALFSAWFRKNAVLKATGRVYYVQNGSRTLLGWHRYNVVLYCLEDDLMKCGLHNTVMVLLEPQGPESVIASYPYITFSDGSYLEYETVEVHPPG